MRFKMRLLFEENNNKINLLNSLNKCQQYIDLKNLCEKYEILLEVDRTKIEMTNTDEIYFSAEYSVSQEAWLISVNGVNKVDSQKFESHLQKITKFFKCVREAEKTINVKEIYNYIDELGD